MGFFNQKLLEKAYFIVKLNGLAIIRSATSDFWTACVASVFVWFRSKERPRNWNFGFGRARNETRAIFAIFRAVFDSRSSFFAPKPRGNALATQANFWKAPLKRGHVVESYVGL